MAQGMGIVPRVSKRGGSVVEKDNAYIKSLIIAGLSPKDSTNPFITEIDPDVEFELNDDTTRGLLVKNIEELFKTFEELELAALATDTNSIIFDPPRDDSEIKLTINFINLETQKPGDVTLSMTPDGIEEVA